MKNSKLINKFKDLKNSYFIRRIKADRFEIIAGMIVIAICVYGAFIFLSFTSHIVASNYYNKTHGKEKLSDIDDSSIVYDVSDSDIVYDVVTWHHVGKIYSVMKELGGSDIAIAGLIGNLWYESSGLDPTSIETVSGEPFEIGFEKQAVIDADFDPSIIVPEYGRDYPTIAKLGVGLMQWTDTYSLVNGEVDQGRIYEGTSRLITYAEEKGLNWYDFDTQLAYMLDNEDGDHPDNVNQLLHIMENGDFTDLTDAVEQISMQGEYGYMGNRAGLNIDCRVSIAEYVYSKIDTLVYDEVYAKNILSK